MLIDPYLSALMRADPCTAVQREAPSRPAAAKSRKDTVERALRRFESSARTMERAGLVLDRSYRALEASARYTAKK